MKQGYEDDLRGVKAIAEYLGVTDRTVKRWLAHDETDFPVSRIGGRWVAVPDDLRGWVGRRQGWVA